MDTNGRRRTNKRWPEALKREIVAATFAPGASVSVVARQYDVNANQVFGWRRRYRAPVAAVATAPPPSRPKLVELTLTPVPGERAPVTPAPIAGDLIEIEVSGTYLVRVGANFDDRTLRRVLDCLRRAGCAREKSR
jgi:transposase